MSLAACDPAAELPRACPSGPGGLETELRVGPDQPRPIDRPLVVRGTIKRPPGITLYALFVGSEPAANLGFDFEAFGATVPFDTLAALAAKSGTGDATVDVTARTNCTTDIITLDNFTVPVRAAVRITQLVFEQPVYPGPAAYLPADKSLAAVLRLRANPEAAGATVTLSAPTGTFGGTGSMNTVVLSGDGKSDATATFTFVADRTTQVSAAAAGFNAGTTITVAGPPAIVPGAATLVAGETLRATVFTDGVIRSCQATPAAGIAVQSGTTDLMATPGGSDLNGDKRVDIDVTAATMLTAPATTTISCIDVYNQSSTAIFKARPAP